MFEINFSDSDYSSEDKFFVSPKRVSIPNNRKLANNRKTPNFRRKPINRSIRKDDDLEIKPLDTPAIEDKFNDFGLNESNNNNNTENGSENNNYSVQVDWNSQSQKRRVPPPAPSGRGRKGGFTRRTVRMIDDNNKNETHVRDIPVDESSENGSAINVVEIKHVDLNPLKEIDDDDESNESSQSICEVKFKKFEDEIKSDAVEEVEETAEPVIEEEEKAQNGPKLDISDMKMLQRYIEKKVPVYYTYDTYLTTKMSIKGRQYEFSFKDDGKELVRATYASSSNTVSIFDVEEDKLQGTEPNHVIIVANGRRDYSLRQDSITGMESMTVRVAHENAKSLTKHEYTAYLYSKVNMFTPLRVFGKAENGSANNISFVDSLNLSVAMKAAKVNKGFINITATETISPIRCFALSIALFLSS